MTGSRPVAGDLVGVSSDVFLAWFWYYRIHGRFPVKLVNGWPVRTEIVLMISLDQADPYDLKISALATTHPHFVRVSALRACNVFPNHKANRFPILRLWWRVHFAASGRVHRSAYCGIGYIGPEGPVRWSGRVVRFAPLSSACLRRVSARPVRRSRHPRRSKAFPSLAGLD
jgi:hypothetical protein